MATLIRERFMELEGVLKTVYDLDQQKRVDYVSKFFNVEGSNRSQENHFGIGSIGLMKPWTGSVSYDTVGKRWVTTYRHKKYSNGLQVEREVFDFKEYADVKKQTRLLSYSAYLTRQTHGMSVFNNAFDTNYPGADGKPLCAANIAGHPFSPDNTDDTQYNADTLDLTPSNIDIIRSRMVQFTDDRGNNLGVNPDVLIYGPSYWKKVKEILGSDKEPYVNTNTTNVWVGEFRPMYCPWITSKKWFMADSNMMNMYLNWYDARKPTLEYVDDHDTEIGSYKTVGLWSYNFDEWYWCYGNNVA